MPNILGYCTIGVLKIGKIGGVLTETHTVRKTPFTENFELAQRIIIKWLS